MNPRNMSNSFLLHEADFISARIEGQGNERDAAIIDELIRRISIYEDLVLDISTIVDELTPFDDAFNPNADDEMNKDSDSDQQIFDWDTDEDNENDSDEEE